MATFNLIQQLKYNSAQLSKETQYTGTLVTLIEDESVADSQTDYQITVALDVSAVQVFYLVSSQAVTFETNDGSTPDDTISLVADFPYVWSTDSYDSFLLGTDLTDVFITNASGSAALINMWALIDPTP